MIKKTAPLTPILIVTLAFLAMISFYWLYLRPAPSSDLNLTQQTTLVEDNKIEYSPIKEVAFIEESYQTIMDNYWKKLSDEQLSELFLQAFSKVVGTQPELKEKNRKGVAELVKKIIQKRDQAEKEKILTQVLDLVLQNLEPFGRSRLFSKQDETKLKERVDNIDPKTDLFEILDTSADATDEEVTKSYQTKKEQISQTATNEAELKKQLAQIDRAYQAVANKQLRSRYAKDKIEPTILGKILNNSTYYFAVKQFSPTTIEDFQLALQKLPTNHHYTNLIFDLRGNQGGAIDSLPYFLGPFIGNNQFGYQFFSQGKTLDFKTKAGRLKELEPFKKVVILIDQESQSSAEVMAASLKKYNVGVLVGTATKGWGTVERVFALKNQLGGDNIYSLFLVHSLTLNEDGRPIEGKGVEPDVDITQSNWQQQLKNYYSDQSLVQAVEQLIIETATM